MTRSEAELHQTPHFSRRGALAVSAAAGSTFAAMAATPAGAQAAAAIVAARGAGTVRTKDNAEIYFRIVARDRGSCSAMADPTHRVIATQVVKFVSPDRPI